MIDAVVDIGNTRYKFCRARAGQLVLPVYGTSDERSTTHAQIAETLSLHPGCCWAIGSTHPERETRFREWAVQRGDRTITIDSPQAVPIDVQVDYPEKVGIDRLLNALAAQAIAQVGQPLIVVDAGSAVTVDLVDESGAFVGGTIFPGLRLMALSLHEHTAKLPLVDASNLSSNLFPPGKNTEQAMRLGILHAVAGGIDAIVRELASQCQHSPKIVLAGGDMTPRLAQTLQCRYQFESVMKPTLTLEGILRAATRRDTNPGS